MPVKSNIKKVLRFELAPKKALTIEIAKAFHSTRTNPSS